MKNPFKILVLCGLVCAALSGCATKQSAKVAASVDQDFINAYDAFEMAKNPRAKVATGDTVSMSEGVWLGDTSTVLEHRNNLPSWISGPPNVPDSKSEHKQWNRPERLFP